MRILLPALLISLIAVSTQAQPATGPSTQPATRPSSPQVEALIVQLSDKQWKVRQQAQDGLVELGDLAVDRLRQLAGQTSDEEVRTRAEAALAQIQANDRSGPTLITLHLDQVPLQFALSELSRQSTTDIATWPPFEQQPNPAKVSLNVDRQPFWAVLREISRQTGLSPERMGSGGRMTLMSGSGNWIQKPFAMQGCFLVVAESANLTHNVDFAQPQNIQSSFNVNFRLYVDPKVHILRGTPQPRLEEVVDDKGNSLAPPGTFADGFSPAWGSRWMWDLNANLNYRPNTGTRIARFRASARFVVQSKSDTWEVADVVDAKDLQRPTPLGKCILKSVTRSQPNNYLVQIAIESAAPMNRARVAVNPLLDFSVIQHGLRLVDAKGRSLVAGGGGSGGSSTPERCDYNLSFYQSGEDGQPVGTPTKLVWEIPLETQEITVPIRFDNLPIP